MTALPLPSRPRRARVAERALELRIDPAVVLAFAVITSLLFVTWFGGLAALGFLLSGFVLWARQPALAVEDLRRYWPILLVPAWAILSTFWSDAPGESLRLGVQLLITFVIAIALGSRLSPRGFVLAALAAYAVAGVASLLFGSVRGDGQGWLGIFGSKNSFAFAMSVLALLAAAVALDRASGGPRARLLRLAALGLCGLGAVLMLLGNSAGATVSTVLAGGVGIGLLWLRVATPAGRLAALVLLTLGVIAAGLVAWGLREALADAFLEATGKDVTLTGRTDLWAEALGAIAERPLLGHGYLAFWVPGNPVAEAMWDMFGISGRSGFHFHNTWLNSAVEIGVPGAAFQLALVLATLVLSLRWALGRPTAASLFFAMFMVRQTAMSLIEVVVFSNFDLNTLLTVTALVAGLRVAGAASSAGRAAATSRTPPSRAGAARRGTAAA